MGIELPIYGEWKTEASARNKFSKFDCVEITGKEYAGYKGMIIDIIVYPTFVVYFVGDYSCDKTSAYIVAESNLKKDISGQVMRRMTLGW